MALLVAFDCAVEYQRLQYVGQHVCCRNYASLWPNHCRISSICHQSVVAIIIRFVDSGPFGSYPAPPCLFADPRAGCGGVYLIQYPVVVGELIEMKLTLGQNLFAVVSYRYIGKRITILVSLTIFTACNAWSSFAASYDSLLATRIVGGMFGGVVEALGPEIIVEIFQEKELASAMVIYVGFLAAGSSIGPIFAGLIGTGTGEWQWYFKFLAIFSGVNLLSCILMLPETTTGTLAPSYLDEVAHSGLANLKPELGAVMVEFSPDSANSRQQQEIHQKHQYSLLRVWWLRSFRYSVSDLLPKADHPVKYLYAPFLMLLQPSVLVTIIVFGLTIGWTVACSIIFANIFQSPPMLWTAKDVGLLNIAPLAGIVLGLPFGGVLADKLHSRSGRRNDGVFVPESRLLAVIFGATLSPAGTLVIGLTMQNKSHWMGQAAGWAMLAFGLTASANVLLTYAVDSYPLKAAQIALLVNVVKNVLGFGVSFETMSWFARDGPAKQYGAMAGALWASYLLVVPLYFLGPKIRARNRSE